MPSSPFADNSQNLPAIRPAGPALSRAVLLDTAADFEIAGSHIARERLHVFIAATGNIQDYNLILGHLRSALDQFSDSVRRFECGDNSFEACKCFGGLNRF